MDTGGNGCPSRVVDGAEDAGHNAAKGTDTHPITAEQRGTESYQNVSSDDSNLSSSSSEDVTSTIYSSEKREKKKRGGRRRRRNKNMKDNPNVINEKIAGIHKAVLTKKEELVLKVSPTMDRIYFELREKKQELENRAEPYLTTISERLVPVDEFLRKVIQETHLHVKEAEEWLDENLPERVLEWFAPEPEEERETFKIHKPSGLSLSFFLLNLAVFVIGGLVFSLGFSVLNHMSLFTSILKGFDPTGRLKNFEVSGFLESFVRTLTLCGAALLGLGYLGAIGCVLAQRKMLKAYAAIVIFFIAIQVLCALFWFLGRTRIYNNVAQNLKDDLRQSYEGTTTSSKPFSHIWDLVQFSFSCCGVLSYTDFVGTPWHRAANSGKKETSSPGDLKNATDLNNLNNSLNNLTESSVVFQFPISCCEALGDRSPESVKELADSQCPVKNASLKNLNTYRPCLKAIVSKIVSRAFVIIGAIVSFVALEVSVVTNALALVNSINDFYDKSRKLKKKKKKKEKQKGKATHMTTRKKDGGTLRSESVSIQTDLSNQEDDNKDKEKKLVKASSRKAADLIPSSTSEASSTRTGEDAAMEASGQTPEEGEEQQEKSKQFKKSLFHFFPQPKFRVGSTQANTTPAQTRGHSQTDLDKADHDTAYIGNPDLSQTDLADKATRTSFSPGDTQPEAASTETDPPKTNQDDLHGGLAPDLATTNNTQQLLSPEEAEKVVQLQSSSPGTSNPPVEQTPRGSTSLGTVSPGLERNENHWGSNSSSADLDLEAKHKGKKKTRGETPVTASATKNGTSSMTVVRRGAPTTATTSTTGVKSSKERRTASDGDVDDLASDVDANDNNDNNNDNGNDTTASTNTAAAAATTTTATAAAAATTTTTSTKD